MLPRTLTIRPATPRDADALRWLAQLDSARPLAGRALVAESDGVPLAAVSLETGSVIADPFRHTADAVRMLVLRREQLVGDRSVFAFAPPRRRFVPSPAR